MKQKKVTFDWLEVLCPYCNLETWFNEIVAVRQNRTRSMFYILIRCNGCDRCFYKYFREVDSWRTQSKMF